MNGTAPLYNGPNGVRTLDDEYTTEHDQYHDSYPDWDDSEDYEDTYKTLKSKKPTKPKRSNEEGEGVYHIGGGYGGVKIPTGIPTGYQPVISPFAYDRPVLKQLFEGGKSIPVERA